MSTRKAHKRRIKFHRGRHRKVRAQTFSSEVKAKAYAQKNDIKSFDVIKVNSGLSKKFKVVSK